MRPTAEGAVGKVLQRLTTIGWVPFVVGEPMGFRRCPDDWFEVDYQYEGQRFTIRFLIGEDRMTIDLGSDFPSELDEDRFCEALHLKLQTILSSTLSKVMAIYEKVEGSSN